MLVAACLLPVHSTPYPRLFMSKLPLAATPRRRRDVLYGAANAWCAISGPPAFAASSTSAEAPADAGGADNIFGKILRGEAAADVVEDQAGSELFTFRDRNPASQLHLLIVPRRFIRDASQLEPTDAALVRHMEAKARELVRAEVGDAFRERELALGFHWPPWYSVPWLHLHAIYPKSTMKRRYKYTAFSFYSPERVLLRLEGSREWPGWRSWFQ